jgi:hypothetical protein
MKKSSRNKAYETKRNRYISPAVRYADKISGPKPRGRTPEAIAWGDKWNIVFHKRMDELSRAAGI